MLAKLLTIGATVLLSLSAATNAQQPAYPTVASRALWLPVTPVANYTLAAMQHVGAQPKSQSQYLDAIPGAYWGPAGPWADQDTYMPRAKPSGWVDPEPSRWPWTGERDPYDYADRSGP